MSRAAHRREINDLPLDSVPIMAALHCKWIPRISSRFQWRGGSTRHGIALGIDQQHCPEWLARRPSTCTCRRDRVGALGRKSGSVCCSSDQLVQSL